jgi:serine protease Do
MTDSLLPRMFGPDGSVFRFGADSVHFVRPNEIFASGMTVGMRSVAGAELSELQPELAEYFGTASGVLVLNARDGTPAASAGLRGGDVILQVNGRAVRSIRELRSAIDGVRPDTRIQLRVLRRGQNVDVTLGRE